MTVVIRLAGCAGACACFALLFHAPRRCVIPASFVGTASYGVYLAAFAAAPSTVAASFAAALCVAILSEWLARRMRAPSTIFISVGIIPLVPGVGLYQTMLRLVQNDYTAALSAGTETLLIAGCIAMAVAIVGTVVLALRRDARAPRP